MHKHRGVIGVFSLDGYNAVAVLLVGLESLQRTGGLRGLQHIGASLLEFLSYLYFSPEGKGLWEALGRSLGS